MLVPIILSIGFLTIFKESDMDDKNKPYKCPECKLLYKEKKWAKKCEAWCKEHKSCNLEITRHAEEVKNNG